jgi:hypothetical protein
MWTAAGSLGPYSSAVYPVTYAGNPANWTIEYGSTGDLSLEGSFAGNIYGSVSGYGSFSTMFLVDNPVLTDPTSPPWGIYNFVLTGYNEFSGKPGGNAAWSADLGGQAQFGYGGSGGYWLAHVSGTDAIWTTDGQIAGTVAGSYLTQTHLGTLSGPFYGLYDEASTGAGYGGWIGESIGIYAGNPLAYNGYWGSGYWGGPATLYTVGSLDGSTSSVVISAHESGLIGGVSPFWTANPDFVAMGTYQINPIYSQLPPSVWVSQFSGSDVEASGNDVAGITTGFWRGGVLDGYGVAVYKGADGTSGILQGPLAGAYYEGLDSSGYGGMWTAGADGGTLARTVKVSAANEIPWQMGMNFATLRLAGQFDGAADSFIMGSGSMITGFLYTETDKDGNPLDEPLPLRWGIYGMNFNGESPFGSDYLSVGNIYQNPGTSTTWKAKVGGIGPFTLVQAPFFFLGDILNGTWDANGNIEGAILSGIYQTLERRGTFSGPFYGLDGAIEEIGYSGSWVGAGVGTYQAQTTEATNAFGGFWGSGPMPGGDRLVNSLFSENSGSMMHAASESGLIAGYTEPWAASAKFQVLGMVQYDGVGYWEYPRYLFNTPVYATDPARNATVDIAVTDGYFEGYSAGIWRQTLGKRPYYDSDDGSIWTSESFPVSGSMGGAIRALAVTPAEADGSRTLKILGSDNVLGTYHPGISMWYAEGNIGPDTAITPQTVLSADDDDVYIAGNSYNDIHLIGFYDADPTSRIVGGEDDYGYGYGGSFETSYFVISDNNNVNPTYSPRWGIYNLMISPYESYAEVCNWYGGKPETAGPWGWSAVVGGQGQFGYDGSGDYGYWLASVKGSWAESGEITGALGFQTGVDGSFGDYVTYTTMGTLSGPFYGIEEYVDNGTWIGQSIGTYQGTPTDFGGDWYHSALYNDDGFIEWDGYGEGGFGFLKRTGGNYDFLAIGDFSDYGSGMEGIGGPYVWSGSMYHEGNADRYLEAFTSGIWEKASSDDASGSMTGYGAALYYTEANDTAPATVGLIAGELTGSFYEMGYGYDEEMQGMWKIPAARSASRTRPRRCRRIMIPGRLTFHTIPSTHTQAGSLKAAPTTPSSAAITTVRPSSSSTMPLMAPKASPSESIT